MEGNRLTFYTPPTQARRQPLRAFVFPRRAQRITPNARLVFSHFNNPMEVNQILGYLVERSVQASTVKASVHFGQIRCNMTPETTIQTLRCVFRSPKTQHPGAWCSGSTLPCRGRCRGFNPRRPRQVRYFIESSVTLDWNVCCLFLTMYDASGGGMQTRHAQGVVSRRREGSSPSLTIIKGRRGECIPSPAEEAARRKPLDEADRRAQPLVA